MSEGTSPGIEAQISKQATTALVTGILGVICCAPLAIWAYIAGSNAEKMIAQHGTGQEHATKAKVGKILAIITAVLVVLGFVISILQILFVGAAVNQ